MKKKSPQDFSCSQWNAVFESHSYLCLYEIQIEAGTVHVVLFCIIVKDPVHMFGSLS